MARVLAFDQSITRCGYVVYDGKDESRMFVDSFSSAEGTDSLDKRARFGRRIKQIVGRWKPDFICFEEARQKIMVYPTKGWAKGAFTVNAKQLLLPAIESQIVQLCVDYSIEFESVPVNTWRKAILGKGNLETEEAKARAVQHCRWLKIGATNHDEAEAACIALWADRCSLKFRAVRDGVKV